MSEDVKEYIINSLKQIEKDFNVRILYAVESGSRAWGFSNKDSDYDVRFIYIRPVKDYLRINNLRDVIDYKDLKDYSWDYPLDFSGWDIRKALYLHYKSNPSLREHLKSNIVYMGDAHIFRGLPSFNVRSLKYHYGSMTKSNYNKYVKKADEITPRVIKTYCYCIRQILAWILLDEGMVNVPINIDELLEVFEEYDNSYFSEKLLDDMRLCVEFYRGGCDGVLDDGVLDNLTSWIETYIDIIDVDKVVSNDYNDISVYNDRFYTILLLI